MQVTGVLLPDVSHKPVFLMCPPRFYDVRYVINPWMEGNISRSSRALAVEQWQRLHNALAQFADVVLVDPQPGSPDMVLAANAGLLRGNQVVLSSFLHPERQGEEEHFRTWFEQAGYSVHELPRDIPFEGEGDALFTIDGKRLWVGCGWRTCEASHESLRALWPSCDVISLRLVDPRFYHLDTCFAPLANGDVMYFPAAFDTASQALIEAHYPPQHRILVEEADAACFACNAVNAGSTILLNEISPGLCAQLEQRGFQVVQVPLTEFLKAGGAAKCLVLRVSPLAVTPRANYQAITRDRLLFDAPLAITALSRQPASDC